MAQPLTLALALFAGFLWRGSGEPLTPPSAARFNSTQLPTIISSSQGGGNGTDAGAAGSRMSPLLTYLPTLKAIVIIVCAFTAALVTCLVLRVIRSGRKIRKTRKYDIITTPAERVEMAPLNQENEEDDDSTLFDVKYR